MPYEHTDKSLYEALGVKPPKAIDPPRRPVKRIPKARRLEAGNTMTVEELQALYAR